MILFILKNEKVGSSILHQMRLHDKTETEMYGDGINAQKPLTVL